MTSFPWEKKSASSYPWEEKENPSLNWQSKIDTSSSYKWQSSQASPSELISGSNSGKFPWEGGQNSYGSTNPFVEQSYRSNPFSDPKQSFPWEISPPAEPPAEPQAASSPSDSKNMFVFGKEKVKNKPIGGSYSSFYNKHAKDNLNEVKKAPGAGTYSSFVDKNALFPWEKDKKPEEDSLESQMDDLIRFPGEELKSVNKNLEPLKNIADEETESPLVMAPNSSKNKSSEPAKSVDKPEDPSDNIKVTVPNPETDKDPVKKEKDASTSSPKSRTLSETKDSKSPIVSPKTPLSRSSSRAKLTPKTAERAKSASDVPQHINKKSEVLARNYLSAYAKPKISLKKKEEVQKENAKPKSYRKEQSINEWVYPSPQEPVDWKTRAEQGLPLHATTDSDPPQSEQNLDSSSLREAAFKKWMAKKKENKTFKKSDLVTVIKDTEEMPTAEEIRQEKFEEWYRTRAVDSDKKMKKKTKEEEDKLRNEEIEKEEKIKIEAKTRQMWEEKDKERKRRIREKKSEEEKKKLEEKKALEEQKKTADKNFESWKNRKDPLLKDEAKKKMSAEKKKEEEERDEKEMQEIEGQKSFIAWKETKEQEIRDKKAEADRAKKDKERQLIRKNRQKESERAKAMQEWTEQKEREKEKLNIPAHISPWKSGPGKKIVISRDEMLMANIKHKKNRQKRSPKQKNSSYTDGVTEVEFIK